MMLVTCWVRLIVPYIGYTPLVLVISQVAVFILPSLAITPSITPKHILQYVHKSHNIGAIFIEHLSKEVL